MSVFVLAYYSYRDPIFQSAVLPYLKATKLSAQKYVVLTFEQEQFKMNARDQAATREALQQYNIKWYATTWNSKRFKLIKKLYDLIKGLVYGVWLINKYKAKMVYAEGFPGAIIGFILSKVTGLPHVIHTFEPHADYMRESGVWSERNWEYRLLKKLELNIAAHAKFILTATQAYKEILVNRGITYEKILVAPSCIDTDHIFFQSKARKDIRTSLRLADDQLVVVYLGKIGGMYMDEEIFEFFQMCRNFDPDKFFFFLLTNESPERIYEKLKVCNIPQSKVFVKFLHQNEVPGFLSAADIGFCGIRPIPSRRFSSPIKNGEYWACGLPVLVPIGVSDDYIIAGQEQMGYAFGDIQDITLETLERLRRLDRLEIQKKAVMYRGLKSFAPMFEKVFKLSA